MKRRRAIASNVKVLFALEDRILRDIGFEHSEVWSLAIAAVDGTADTGKSKELTKTLVPAPKDTAKYEDSMPMAG